MTVRIRMKKMGRSHRPFFRICAMDIRAPRDGKVLEELGTYDPLVRDTHARAVMVNDRVDYWLGVGAQPSEKVAMLIKKYGSKGTHAEAQKSALAQLAQKQPVPPAPTPVALPKKEAPAAEPTAEAASGEASEAPAEG
jgi:small subunit ribosomal protein S16